MRAIMNNKYGSSASTAVWENAAKVRKFKYEQQMKASRPQAYAMLFFTVLLIGTIVYNVVVGMLR